MPSFIPVPISPKVLKRLKALKVGDPLTSLDERIAQLLNTVEYLTKSLKEHNKQLAGIRTSVGIATPLVRNMKAELHHYKVFVEWLDQHPELDKTEIIGLWVNRSYGQIALRYANFDFPEGFFPEK